MRRREVLELVGGVCVVIAAGMFEIALGVLAAGVLMILVANLGEVTDGNDAG